MNDVKASKDLHDPYLAQISSILRRALQGTKCRVYLFGSRAVRRHSDTSDFDLAVLASADVSRELGIAREMLEASNIPFTVDVVDLQAASGTLARRVGEEGILLWSN